MDPVDITDRRRGILIKKHSYFNYIFSPNCKFPKYEEKLSEIFFYDQSIKHSLEMFKNGLALSEAEMILDEKTQNDVNSLSLNNVYSVKCWPV